jgi:hypothetical protein
MSAGRRPARSNHPPSHTPPGAVHPLCPDAYLEEASGYTDVHSVHTQGVCLVGA